MHAANSCERFSPTAAARLLIFHQAGYSQRKEDIRSLNDSISKLQEQVKRAENFVSGLQGARPVLQSFSDLRV